jgi:hypothetical protein
VDRRVTVVVALFVGAIALVGTWLLLSSDATVAPTARTGPGATAEDRNVAAGEPREGIGATAHERKPMREPGRGPTTIEELRARGINTDRLATPVAGGGGFTLDSEGVAAAVASRKAGLDACYGTARLHSPELAATQSLTLDVEPAPGETWGTVSSVDADGAPSASVFESCAGTVLGEIRFRDVTGPSTLTVPVTLSEP